MTDEQTKYSPKSEKKPYEADHEHKFVRVNRFLEACEAGDGCRLGRVSRAWLVEISGKERSKP